MYGLPKDFDGSFLVGRTLEMVCFSQYQVYLHFDEKIIITVASAFSYKTDLVVDVPVQESNLMELVGSSVLAASGEVNGTLSLLFNTGQALKIYDTSKQYESYAIAHDGKEIIV
jgi:hypothetical protein